eukprot:6482932-Amphidinium_carterae.1
MISTSARMPISAVFQFVFQSYCFSPWLEHNHFMHLQLLPDQRNDPTSVKERSKSHKEEAV